MTNNFKSILAICILILLISNFMACDDTALSDNEGGGSANGSQTYETSQNQTEATNKQDVYAPAWDKLMEKVFMTHTSSPFANKDIRSKALPLQFLQEEGLIIKNEWNEWYVDDPDFVSEEGSYDPFQSYAFVNKKSPENDIYLIVNYQNQRPIQLSSGVTGVAGKTWILKYTVSDEDYKRFLQLDGDWRIKYFVQTIDEVYKPQLLSSAIASQEILDLANPDDPTQTKFSVLTFPNIFVSKIDDVNKSITFGSISDGQVKFIEFDAFDSAMWQRAQTEGGYDEEKYRNEISLEYKQLKIGKCLDYYLILGGAICSGLSIQDAQSKFNESQLGANLSKVSINSSQNKVSYGSLIK